MSARPRPVRRIDHAHRRRRLSRTGEIAGDQKVEPAKSPLSLDPLQHALEHLGGDGGAAGGSEPRMPPEQEVTYGLLRDEWIYIAAKPAG